MELPETNPNDIVRTCRDCSRKFVVTEDEQNFMASKGYALPNHCLTCRKIRRRNEVRRREQREKQHEFKQRYPQSNSEQQERQD